LLAPTTDFSKIEQGEAKPGGDATSRGSIETPNAFSLSSGNMDFKRELDFKVGNGIFRKNWVSSPASTDASDGLGPLFNSRGCQNCHLKDGRTSRRCLALATKDTIVFGCQYCGPEADAPPLIGFHRRGETPAIVSAPSATQVALRNYIGSVAADSAGGIVAASSPKGGLVTYWDVAGQRYLGSTDLNDGCGLAPMRHRASFLLTSGEGWLASADASGQMEREASKYHWDNHAILVT